MKSSILLITLAFLGLTCSDSYQVQRDESGKPVVMGKISRELFTSDNEFKEWFDFNYKTYAPNEHEISAIDSLSNGITFYVFLGTWCSDSKREVPHLLKILDSARVDKQSILLYGLDHQKKSPSGFESQFDITFVPTIIVKKDSLELGRIVEEPQESMEEDLRNILEKH